MAVNPMMNTPRLEGVLNMGLKGMSLGLNGVQNAAQEIAELNLTEAEPGGGVTYRGLEDAVEAVTSMKIYQRQVEASARVVETADELLGFLIDVRA